MGNCEQLRKVLGGNYTVYGGNDTLSIKTPTNSRKEFQKISAAMAEAGYTGAKINKAVAANTWIIFLPIN